MGAIWYQEEKERKNKALAAEKAEQNNYNEKLTNIRAADVPIYRDIYKKWVNAKTELGKIGKKGDNEAYQKKLDESQILYGQINQLVNSSLAEKKRREKLPDYKDRSDEFDEIIGVYNATPTSELNKKYKTKSGREIILAEDEPLIYRPNQMDYTALGKAGLGTPKKGGLKYVDLGNGERKKVVPEYFNNPVAIADAVANEMNKVRNGVREVETNLGFLEAQQPKIESEFDAYINSPEYKEIYGTDAPTFTQPRTRAEKLTQLFAKDLFLKNKPRFIDGEQETTPQEKLRVEAARDKRELGQQIDAEKRADARAIAREKRKNAFDIKLKSLGLGKKDAEEFDYVRRLADVANYVEGSGEEIPFDLQGVRSDVYGVAKSDAPLLDVTATFKDVKYSDDNSESTTKDGATKTLKSSKIERVFKNAKNGDLMVKFNNKEDAAKIMGRNVEDLVDPNGYHVLRGKSAKDAFLKAVASSYKFNEEKTRLITSRIDNDQTKPGVQSKDAQQPKTKEAPKAKQVSKPASEMTLIEKLKAKQPK
jgi:hypothetical protein